MYQSFIHDLTYHKHMTNKCNWEKKDIHVPIYIYTISHTVNIWQTNVIVMGEKKTKKKKEKNIGIFTNIFYMENI